jgi:Tfp pilus assembly protein PilV
MPRLVSNDGFSLVESLIACVVLATALLSIGYLANSVVTSLTDSRTRTLATILASAKLEELRTARAPAAGADVVDSMGQVPSLQTSRRFDRRWSATPVSGDVQILNVVVTPFPRGVAREVRITGGWTQ